MDALFEVIVFIIIIVVGIIRAVARQNKKKTEQANPIPQDKTVVTGHKQQHMPQQQMKQQSVQQPMQQSVQQRQNPATPFQGETSGRSKIEEWLYKLEMVEQEAKAQKVQVQQAAKAKEAAEREHKQRRRKERERKELEQQRQQEPKPRAQKQLQPKEIPQVTPVGGLGLRSREDLVRGIILSEVLGTPKSRRIGSHKI